MKETQPTNVDMTKNPFYVMRDEGLASIPVKKDKQEHNFEYFTEKRRNAKELKAYLRRKIAEFDDDKDDDENIR